MRPNIALLLSNAAVSMSVVFIPLAASQYGASDMMVGYIVSVYGLMSLFSLYIFGWIGDEKGRLWLIRWGLFASIFIFAAQIFADDPMTLFIARAACGLALGIFSSALVMYGMEAGQKIGKYTAYESMGWAIGMLAAGIIAVYDVIFAMSSLLFAAAFLMSLRFDPLKEKTVHVPLLPYKIINKNFAIFIPFILRDIGAFSIWAFFPIYLAALGASNLWIGILWFLNTISQVLFKQFIDGYDHRRLFHIGMGLSALVFFCYGIAWHYTVLIPVQVLLGLAWAVISVGAIGALTDGNREKTTVIGLFWSSRSFARIFAPIIAGALITGGGFPLLMLFAGSITIAGLLAGLYWHDELPHHI